MKGILDTHTFIWWDSDPSKLSGAAQLFLRDPTNTIFLSAVSVWEIVIKHQSGKLILTMPVQSIVARQRSNGLLILPAMLNHVYAVGALPMVHKDPFDRLLAAQAITEGAALVSADPIFAQYAIHLVW